MFEKELLAIQRANLTRSREVFDDDLVDLASNDYLGLSTNKKTLKKAYTYIKDLKYHSPRASMMVNGYSVAHKRLEELVSSLNGFEAAMCMTNGFCANLSLIESFCRKGDVLFMDEKYHASGILASKTIPCEVVFFKHNDHRDLRKKIFESRFKKIIIAVEGVYSMDGDLLDEEIINVSDEFEALLILDEAHSSGVLGNSLLGILDYYYRPVKSHYVKMGTLGKAYGSFGAYVCASNDIVKYLENRAKSAIYTTAPSIFESALSYENIIYVKDRVEKIKQKIIQRQELFELYFDKRMEAMIGVIEIGDIQKLKTIKDKLLQNGILVGAIRPPTVKKPILRIIPNCSIKQKELEKVFEMIRFAL
jgi:8-amino-7-oxononanoate synthase